MPVLLGVWVGTAYVAGMSFAPRPTRAAAAVLRDPSLGSRRTALAARAYSRSSAGGKRVEQQSRQCAGPGARHRRAGSADPAAGQPLPMWSDHCSRITVAAQVEPAEPVRPGVRRGLEASPWCGRRAPALNCRQSAGSATGTTTSLRRRNHGVHGGSNRRTAADRRPRDRPRPVRRGAGRACSSYRSASSAGDLTRRPWPGPPQADVGVRRVRSAVEVEVGGHHEADEAGRPCRPPPPGRPARSSQPCGTGCYGRRCNPRAAGGNVAGPLNVPVTRVSATTWSG